MICRDDLPDTPDWVLPPRDTADELTIPPNVILGGWGE